MSIVDLRKAIVDGLTADLGALVQSVQVHGGNFGPDEIKRYTAKMPAVFVACLGASKTEVLGGEPYAHFDWVAAVVAKDGSKAGDRSETALLIGAEVTRVVASQRWGVDGAGNSKEVVGRSIYNADLDKMGVALWMTVWRQALPLQPLTPEQLDSFNTFVDQFDLAPPDGVIDASDQVAMEQS